MSVYKYPESQVIDEVTFTKNAKGGVRAYLHADDGVVSDHACQIIDALRKQDFECVPYNLDGKPVVEVRGFKRESDLLGMLGQNEWIKGKAQIIPDKTDRITLMDKIAKRSLQASGATYLAGDFGFIRYGHREKDNLVKAGGLSYFLGTLALLFYGRNDQSNLQVHDLAKSIEQFAKREDIDVPPGSVVHALAQDKKSQNILERMNEFGQRHPSEMFNSVTALAGAFVATAAYRNKVKFTPTALMDAKAIREMRHEGWMDVGLGATTVGAGLLATLVKEKKHDPDDPPLKGLKWVKQKLQEHPLAIAGGGYLVATLCHAASTCKAYIEAKRVKDAVRLASVPDRAFFVAMAFVSEVLLGISSKGHGEGVVSDSSVDNSAIAIAAELIAHQPVEQQDKLIAQMAQFLGEQKVLALKDQELRRTLQQQVEGMRTNLWAQRGSLKDQFCGAVDAPVIMSAKTQTWQSKVAPAHNVPLQPQFSV